MEPELRPIAVHESKLQDLDRRLRQINWPADYNNDDGRYGVQRAFLERVVDQWLNRYDWRFATGNVWAVEQLLIDWPHHRIRTSDARHRQLKRRYAAYRRAHGVKPIYYARRDRWMPLPPEFSAAARRRRSQPGARAD